MNGKTQKGTVIRELRLVEGALGDKLTNPQKCSVHENGMG